MASQKLREVLALNDAVGLLKRIVDVLEGKHGPEPDFPIQAAASLRKLRISLKRDTESDLVSVKVKFTGVTPEAVPTAPPRAPGEAGIAPVPYKDLKRRMKKLFRAISDELKAGSLPSGSSLREFFQLSGQMVTCPDRGEEHYEEYSRTCRRLEAAFDSGDLEGCRSLVVELNRMKTECHTDHK
jgi:XXXCH domain-containing protein